MGAPLEGVAGPVGAAEGVSAAAGEALPPVLRDGEAQAVAVGETEGAAEAVAEGLGAPSLAVGGSEGVALGEAPAEAVPTDGVAEREGTEGVGGAVAERDAVGVVVGDAEGVAQVVFFECDKDDVCETSYKDRGGKYQGQKGVTLPKI